jgi:hypothetical protein
MPKALNGKGKQKSKMSSTMYTGVRLISIERHARGNAAYQVLKPFKSHPLYHTAERAAHGHDDGKRAHPEHYLNKNKPQGDPSSFNFPIGDNEKTYPSVTNVHSERALNEFCETDEVLAYEQEFMSIRASHGFKVIFKRHQERCKIEDRKLRQRTEGAQGILRMDTSRPESRKAKCYLCQDDLSSLWINGPLSKMMDRRNSSADTGNYKKDYTRDNTAYTSVTNARIARGICQKRSALPCAVRLLMHTKTSRC